MSPAKIEGVLNLDKPIGLTSFDVVARVRRAFGEKRVGHAGTLDPMATGVLPVCIGEATKLVPYLQDGEKGYLADALLGVTTDSEDATGRVLHERDASHLTLDQVSATLATLVGTIQQIPPMHSAIRVDGKRLYELAHQGKTIERAARTVHIAELRVESFAVEGNRARVRFFVRCGKGTYVRTIGADLGAKLGVGAHLTQLRRTQVGPFAIATALPMDFLAAPEAERLLQLQAPARALAHLPTLSLDADETVAVRAGKSRRVAALGVRLPAGAGPFIAVDPKGALVAVLHRSGPQADLALLRVFG